MYILPEIAEKYPTLAEFAAAVVRNRNEDHCWDNTINENLTAVKADTNKLTWEFKVQKSHCNMLGSLHGGCVATLIDVCSTCTILTYEGKSKWKTVGVSTDLSISYIRGISPGSVARIECEVQRVGKTMANIYTTIYDERNNLCYTGSHTKFCVDSKM
ncbi:HotDog domain-containing protein [Phycomyces nitens]|nr:HotDog domain-containing protein [Phycomyces nitens]